MSTANIDFGQLLKHAWDIVQKNRGLWILGILASCLNTNPFNNGNSDFNSNNRSNDSSSNGDLTPEFENFIRQTDFFSIATGVFLGLLCVILILVLIAVVLGLIGRGGLIGGTRLANTNGQVSFIQGWSEGTRNFGRLFSLWLFTGLPGLLITLAFLVGIFLFVLNILNNLPDLSRGNLEGGLLAQLGVFFVCLVVFICIAGPLNIALSIFNHMGTLVAVFEQQSGMAALKRGWVMLRSHPAPLLVLGAVLVVADLIISLISNIPFLIPLALMGGSVAAGAFANSQSLIGGGVLLALICCAAYLPIILVVRGVFTNWAWSAWTLLYDQLTAPSPPPPAPASFEPAPVSQ